MLRISTAALIAAFCFAQPARADEILPGSHDAALADRLITKEKDTWRLYREKDAAALSALTSEDFRDLYSDGEVVNKQRWLEDMKGVDVDRFTLSQFHVFSLADDSILLTYRGEAWAHSGGKRLHNKAAVTSVWAKRGDKWVNVFYGEAALTPDSVFAGGAKRGH